MSTSHTCTIRIAADGTECGKPAATSFTTARGVTLHECEEHAWVSPTSTPDFSVGDLVQVRAYGRVYEAGVVAVTPTRVQVRFVTRGGKNKFMYFAKSEVLS